MPDIEVGPISGRDFINVHVHLKLEENSQPVGPEKIILTAGSFMCGGIGLEKDSRFPEDKKFVRGINAKDCGWLCEPFRGGESGITQPQLITRVHYIIHTNMFVYSY